MAEKALAAILACLLSAAAPAAKIERVPSEAQLDALLGEPGVAPK